MTDISINVKNDKTLDVQVDGSIMGNAALIKRDLEKGLQTGKISQQDLQAASGDSEKLKQIFTNLKVEVDVQNILTNINKITITIEPELQNELLAPLNKELGISQTPSESITQTPPITSEEVSKPVKLIKLKSEDNTALVNDISTKKSELENLGIDQEENLKDLSDAYSDKKFYQQQKNTIAGASNLDMLNNCPEILSDLKAQSPDKKKGEISYPEFAEITAVIEKINKINQSIASLRANGVSENSNSMKDKKALLEINKENLENLIGDLNLQKKINSKKESLISETDNFIVKIDQTIEKLEDEGFYLEAKADNLEMEVKELETKLNKKQNESQVSEPQKNESSVDTSSINIKTAKSMLENLFKKSEVSDTQNIKPPHDPDDVHNMTRQALEQNYTIIPNSGQGDCLFKSFAQGQAFLSAHGNFAQSEDQHVNMRVLAVDYMIHNNTNLNTYNDVQNNTEYLSNMLLLHQWGGLPEINSLVNNFNQPLVIHIESPDHVQNGGLVMSFTPNGEDIGNFEPQNVMHIAMSYPETNQAHFELLVPKGVIEDQQNDDINLKKTSSSSSLHSDPSSSNLNVLPKQDSTNNINQPNVPPSLPPNNTGGTGFVPPLVKTKIANKTKLHLFKHNTDYSRATSIIQSENTEIIKQNTKIPESTVSKDAKKMNYSMSKWLGEVSDPNTKNSLNRSTFTFEVKVGGSVGVGTDYISPGVSMLGSILQTEASLHFGVSGGYRYKADIERNEVSGEVIINFEHIGRIGAEVKTKAQLLGADIGIQVNTPFLEEHGVHSATLGNFDVSKSKTARSKVSFTFGSMEEALNFVNNNGNGFTHKPDHHEVKPNSNNYNVKSFKEIGNEVVVRQSGNRRTEATTEKWFQNMPRFNNREIFITSQNYNSEQRTNYNMTTKMLIPFVTKVTSEVSAEVVFINPREMVQSNKKKDEIGSSVADLTVNDIETSSEPTDPKKLVGLISEIVATKLDIERGIDFSKSEIEVDGNKTPLLNEVKNSTEKSIQTWLEGQSIIVDKGDGSGDKIVNLKRLSEVFPDGNISLSFIVKHNENDGVTVETGLAPKKVFDRANININFDMNKILKNKDPEALKEKLATRLVETMGRINGFNIYGNDGQLNDLGNEAVEKLKEGIGAWLDEKGLVKRAEVKPENLLKKDEKVYNGEDFDRMEINVIALKANFGSMLSVGFTIEPISESENEVVKGKLEKLNKKSIEIGGDYGTGTGGLGIRGTLKFEGIVEKSHTVKLLD